MLINLQDLSPQKTYFTMTQSLLPRPIAWVLTQNDASNNNDSYNLAPFSYFNAVASEPPLIMFSIGLKDDGSEKDTLINLKQRLDFVLHIASVEQLNDLNMSSANLAHGESEVTTGNLATTKIEGFSLPRLSACKLAYLCRVYDIQTIGNTHQALVFGQVQHIYIDDDCATINQQGRLKIDAKKINPLARLGAGQYATLGEILVAERPS